VKQFILEAGWGIYPVLLVGSGAVLVSIALAVSLRSSLVPLLGALVVSTLISGVLGAVLGGRNVLELHGQEGASSASVALGMREASNNLLAALFASSAATLGAIVAGLRHAWRSTKDEAP
jgi:hypothetical protein